jgi:uncharacterized protein YodC (DUF2158 family)
MSKFKVGDTVRLKSGGPVMTVRSVDDTGKDFTACMYFQDGQYVGLTSSIWFNDALLDRVDLESGNWYIVAEK